MQLLTNAFVMKSYFAHLGKVLNCHCPASRAAWIAEVHQRLRTLVESKLREAQRYRFYVLQN